MAVVLKHTKQMHLTSVQREKRGLPKPILYYLKKNANPKLLLKLMQTSKYFCFEEFPFMVIKVLKCDNEKWEYCKLGSDKYEILDINDIPKKLWITKSLKIFSLDSNVASSIISKIIVGDNIKLYLSNQKITFNEFKFLTNASMLVSLVLTTVDKENGEIAPIEMLLQNLSTLKVFACHLSEAESLMFTSESTKNIIKALMNSKIQGFVFHGIPETFDFDAFSKFMTKTPHMYGLQFRDNISDELRQKLQTFQNIISMNSVDSFRFELGFPGQMFPTKEKKYLLKCLLCFLISSVLYLLCYLFS